MSKLAEAVVDDLVSLLSSQLASKLAAIETEMGDGVTLAPPASVIVGERAAAEWPALWVHATRSSRPIDENREAYDGQFPLGTWVHGMQITIAATDPDSPDRLRRRLYRYVRAITEVINDAEHDTARWIRARITDHGYEQAFFYSDDGLFRQDAVVVLQVTRVD